MPTKCSGGPAGTHACEGRFLRTDKEYMGSDVVAREKAQGVLRQSVLLEVSPDARS